MIQRLLRRFRVETTVLRECRHCGTAVDTPVTRCPSCEREDIALYQLRDGPS